MYNTSPRFGLEKPTPTTPEVGPSTYILDDYFQLQRVNVVPFGSSSERKNTFVQPKFTDALYNCSLQTKILGGHSLRNKSKRFIYKNSDIPPPGTYNPKLPGRKERSFNLPPSGKGKIYFCKVPYNFLGSAPSIPTKRDAYGYEIDKSGKIIKNRIPCREKEIGPSYYYINVASCVNDNPYSGCHWSRRTSKRSTYRIEEGPGPAAYDVRRVSTCRFNEKEQEYREMAQRFSYLPRYTEQQIILAKRKNYPSPGQYEIQSCFTLKPPVTNVVKPFISRKKRFEDQERGRVIHTIYDIGTPIGRKDWPSVKEIPFSFNAERFRKKKIDSSGPDLYMPKGFADKIKERNSRSCSMFRAPFNSTAGRQINFVSGDSLFDADCATYPREETSPSCQKRTGCSVFLSTTKRSDTNITAAPPVTRYDAIESFNRMKNKTVSNAKKLPFQETSERKTVILPHKDDPGPADYLGQSSMKKRGFFFDRTKRFEKEIEGTPPPDHYYIHPMYGESIFAAKNTFNLKIAESVIRKKLRVPPKDTFSDYIRTLKTTKRLKCYTSLLDQ